MKHNMLFSVVLFLTPLYDLATHMSSWVQLVHEFVVVASYIGCLLVEFAFFAIATSTNFGIHSTIVIHLLSNLLAIASDHFESGFLAGMLYLPVPVLETVVLLL